MAKDPLTGAWIGYGPGDVSPEVHKVERRLLLAYPKNSHAVEHGVQIDDVFTNGTAAALRDLTEFMNNDPREHERLEKLNVRLPMRSDGIADLNVRRAIGAYIDPPAVVQSKYPIQGVFHNTNAFLNPDPFHNFVQATNEGAAEALRLYSTMPGRDIVVLGYSMGGVTAQKFLNRLPVEWRKYVRALVTFGDPSMPAEGSLLGNDPGEGISKAPQPTWIRDRYWSYSIDGDWYPRARGLLFLMYDILTRAALTMEFAVYLFTQLPSRLFQELIGMEDSDDPLAGALAPLGDLLMAGRGILNPAQMFAILPDLFNLLFDAIKFVATNAHGKYGDPGYALWGGMTAVDHAAATIRERVPNGATLFLLPGTWSMWNQLFPFDTAVRLQ